MGKVTNFLPFSLFGLVAHRDPSEGGKYRAKEQKSKGGGEEEDDTTQGTGWLVLVLVSGNRLDKSIFIKLMGRSREMLPGVCAHACICATSSYKCAACVN